MNRARNDAAWPALLLALRRADDLGLDPADVLDAAIDRKTLRTTTSISQTVALHIHRHLDARSTAATDDPRATWPRITRLLARLEQTGTDPAAALAAALAALESAHSRATLTQLAGQLRAAARQLASPRLPAWLRTAQPVTDPEWKSYLDTRAELIRRRVDQLAQAAVSARPAWTAHLGDQPTDPAERERWRRHLATVAAYRDQYQVADDDPDHPLGPYPERGRVGRRAYWIAAASLLALRGTSTNTDLSWGRLAADRYRTLDPAEQDRIAVELAGRLGPHWLGDARDPAADADQPVYRDHLAAVLVEHGHLAPPICDRSGNQVARVPRAPRHVKQRQNRARAATEPRGQQPFGPAPRPGPNPPSQHPPQTPPIQHPPDQSRTPRPGL